MSDKTRSNHLLSYPVIVLASGGDVDATYAVFRYNRNTSTYENWGDGCLAFQGRGRLEKDSG